MHVTILTRTLATAGAIVATATLLAAPAFAQTTSAPLSRAAVKAETRAANLAWQLLPAGEAIDVRPQAADTTHKTRTERKAETLQARRNGELLPSGEGLYRTYMSQHAGIANSTKTRAERKAETLEAAKQHKLMPAGEAVYPQS
jgi:hypothetical protein